MEVVLWKTESIERRDKLGNRLQVIYIYIYIYIYIQKNLLDCLAIQKSRSLISWPLKWLYSSVGVIIFCSVRFLLKKSNQTIFFFKKNQNRTETCSNRPVSVRVFWTKTGSNWFGLVFLVWLGFFPVWVQFGFFGFKLIKLNRSVFSKF